MLSQHHLTSKVLQHLKQRHSIRLSLPNLEHSIDSKVTLKYLKSFSLAKDQNRYQLLVTKIDDLLKRNLLNVEKIKAFSEDFFNTITEDIVVLEQNQRLRRKIPLVKEQILLKNQEMQSVQQNLKAQCLLINDKEDVLQFISSTLKEYLGKLNSISELYLTVNNLQILTSINIDTLYRQQLTSQQDYSKNHPLLLQLLNKLKSTMLHLYQQIQQCDPYDIPLRSVNFLANCKNLIQELAMFLLNDDCSFNRLIFYVVKCQKDNLELVAANYQQGLLFCKQLSGDLFKSYFLGFMFKELYAQVKEQLELRRQQVLRLINDEEITEIKLNQLLKIQILNLQQIKQSIKQIKRIIGIGKDGFMKQYVRKKQCKKLNLIQQCHSAYTALKKMIQKFTKYYQMKKLIQKLSNKQIQQSSYIIKQIRILQKLTDIKQMIGIDQSKQKVTPKKRFQLAFLKLQQLQLQVSTLKNQLVLQKQGHQGQKGAELLVEYISHRIGQLQVINKNYLELETKLLNTYVTLQSHQQKMKEQSEKVKETTLHELQKYFENQLSANLGFTITNEDQLCQQIKQKIMSLGKAEYMLRQFRKQNINDHSILQKTKNDEDEIRFYRNNLEWLLIVFEGSMDEKIFELMMDKLAFDVQDYVATQSKVKEFIGEMNKYVNDLKGLLKSHPLSQLHPTIYKLIKDRIQLYQLIIDLYSQCLLVYTETKKKDPAYNIEAKGLMLFDEETFKFVLMLYQFRNKLRMEMAELKELMVPARVKSYLIEELYEPFSVRFGQFVGFGQQQLLNLTLRLQHALNTKQSQPTIISLFTQQLTQPYSSQYIPTITSLCQQLSKLAKENTLLLMLESQPVVVHNLGQFKEMVQGYDEYYRLAEELVKDLQRGDVVLKMMQRLQLKNQEVNRLRKVVSDRWNQHLGKQQGQSLNIRSRSSSKVQSRKNLMRNNSRGQYSRKDSNNRLGGSEKGEEGPGGNNNREVKFNREKEIQSRILNRQQ